MPLQQKKRHTCAPLQRERTALGQTVRRSPAFPRTAADDVSSLAVRELAVNVPVPALSERMLALRERIRAKAAKLDKGKCGAVLTGAAVPPGSGATALLTHSPSGHAGGPRARSVRQDLLK